MLAVWPAVRVSIPPAAAPAPETSRFAPELSVRFVPAVTATLPPGVPTD